MEGVNIWWYNTLTPRGGADIWCCNILRRWKFNAMIYLPQCRGVKISCCNTITPWGRNIMARVNILYLNVHPGVLILYNKFTQGCSYYITSPPGSETLGECKYYLTHVRPAVLMFHTTWHVLPIYKLDWANEHCRNYVCVRLTGARGTLYPPGRLPERISTGRRNTPLGRLACLPEQVYSFNAPGHKSLSHYDRMKSLLIYIG